MKRFFKDVSKYWRWVIYAGQSELKAEVANSYLNWLWWVIEPLCFMFIYSFVFGTLFGSKIEHMQIFVYIGITMWDFFSRMMNASVKIVRNNKPIVSKVYIPKYMLIFVKMYVNAFKMVVSFAILIVMMIVMHIPFTLYMFWIIPILLVLFIFTFGAGTFQLHFGVFVVDLAYVVSIVLRMVMYLTGVFYDLQDRLKSVMSEKHAIMVGNFNPAASLIADMRNVIMYATGPNTKFLLIWLIVGMLLSIGGVALIYKNENSYVKVI